VRGSDVLAWVGGGILLLLLLGAVLGPLSGYDVVADVDPQAAFSGPSWAHWLGTDHLGRDVAWRLVIACGPLVGPGLLACATGAALAVPLGTLAGVIGGPVGSAVRFLFTVVEGLPRFVLVLLVLAIYGQAGWILALVAGVAYAPTLGEAIYERLEGLRQADFILASRAHGVPERLLVVVHLLWGACRRLIARHLLGLFAFFLVLETTLSYLEFGVAQPWPSWGNMLAFDLDHADAAPVALLAPAVAIWLVLAATTWVRRGLAERGHDA